MYSRRATWFRFDYDFEFSNSSQRSRTRIHFNQMQGNPSRASHPNTRPPASKRRPASLLPNSWNIPTPHLSASPSSHSPNKSRIYSRPNRRSTTSIIRPELNCAPGLAPLQKRVLNRRCAHRELNAVAWISTPGDTDRRRDEVLRVAGLVIVAVLAETELRAGLPKGQRDEGCEGEGCVLHLGWLEMRCWCFVLCCR